MQWTVFDLPYCIGALPISHRATVQSLIDGDPATKAQFEATVASVRQEWRAAIKKTPGNTLDTTETTLPDLVLRHAATEVEYEVNRLTGYWPPPLSQLIRAEVYLRSLTETKIRIVAPGQDEDDGNLAPSYEPPTTEPDKPLA